MDLLLWRHAEAEDAIPDAKRRLTLRGEKQARQIAAWLKENGPADLRVIASPATRCQQTAETLGLPFETDRRLSIEGDVAALLAAVNWPDGDKTGAILVVGHQPTLGQTAACCSPEQKPTGPSRRGRCGGSATVPGAKKHRPSCERSCRQNRLSAQCTGPDDMKPAYPPP